MGFPLLVFADDWGRHPSSCQHLIRSLLPRHPTTWVNTIGTRTPRFDLATLRRAAGKFRQWFSRERSEDRQPLPPGLTIRNPRMWPWLTQEVDRHINRALLVRQLEHQSDELPVAITTLPVVADLMDQLRVARWVYYCVDDFGEWPGLDRETMRRLERIVVRKANVIVAASEILRSRLKTMGRDSHLLTHGVDLDYWRQPHGPTFGLDHLEGPFVVFWGVIDRRMDTEFLRTLTTNLSSGTVVLAGPEQDPDPELSQLRRIHRTGPLPFEVLPALARDAAVLIMPYVDQPVTRAMQPLKLKEYLATDKPIIVRDLPANREWADALDLADTPEHFWNAVRTRLSTGLPVEQRVARERLAKETWQNKAEQFERWIGGNESD